MGSALVTLFLALKKTHKNVLAEKKLAAIMRATSSETLAGFAASKKILKQKALKKRACQGRRGRYNARHFERSRKGLREVLRAALAAN
ncbi:hypothetical protein OQJ68_14875 [Microbulbifer thermotolerans]|uniref:50S ribosomal protein L35 n=1 Tax=Microbulbifer thermotolerans TaxID=252514 RepID=A0AB35I405_MICTH|nr:hypothetical protein [Microbulbifer thermotolerans]MCX2803075.1 hypothetical protein [Microbulbifer thermotolerans]